MSKFSLHYMGFVLLGGAAACAESGPTASLAIAPTVQRIAMACTATIQSLDVSCSAPSIGGRAVKIGGQNTLMRLTSTNLAYDAGTDIFSFDVTVQNLMNEAIGTPDGTTADPQGIQVYFHSGPTVSGGTGVVTVANEDGIADFSFVTNRPFFQYNEILAKDEVSPSKPWQFNVPGTVTSFRFLVYLETDIQYLLVINELLANPGGTISDASGEWLEIYNAGTRPVDLQNLVIADSAASGRRPYHLISSSVIVPSGGYVVLGNTTNTTNNGGVPVDYAYGSAMAFANSLDAVKISRVYGTDGNDTLTLDRTQYASAAISAQNGVSRELTRPSLDNANMDGSDWADALVTAVYGPGGRGTPKSQNSTYTP